MWVFWTTDNKVDRVKGGKKVALACGYCKKTAPFYECTSNDSVKLYSAINVWNKNKRIMQCGECLAVCDYYAIFPQEKIDDELKAAEAKQQELQRKQQQELEAQQREELRKQREAEAKLQQEELSRMKREAHQQASEAKVEDELAKLKRQMGK